MADLDVADTVLEMTPETGGVRELARGQPAMHPAVWSPGASRLDRPGPAIDRAMRTVAVVQARMTSTRLPGKVMRKLRGRTVLEHVLRRCEAVAGIDAVCCATPDDPASDPVAAEARRLGVALYRGSETDVLARYHGAATMLQAEVVVRVTSDCPLIDPAVCAAVLRLRRERAADYAANTMPRAWPHGLDCEAIRFDWLDRAHREAREPYDREHVSPYVRRHPAARKANLAGPGGRWANQRWTLDTPDDWRYIAAIFDRLPDGPAGWDYRAAMRAIDAEPGLAALNPIVI